jgi:hypothetical protein
LKKIKLLDQLNISRISGMAGSPVSSLPEYPAGQSGIQPDTGFKKRPNYLAGYPAGRISGASLASSVLNVE